MSGRWRRLERLTRPVDPRTRQLYDQRWAELPEGVRTPAQVLGRHGVGCEGTHGVFPRCNFACSPCYHSADANRVKTDGPHTLRQIKSQMALFRDRRGPYAHAQLIGGEVSLLDPDDHAAALAVMHAHGRNPMSMTHGDFDDDYLRRLALGPDGRPRFKRLSFAAHIDMTMRGRRGARRPANEAHLNDERQRFADMWKRLKSEHGIKYFLAHNMTVTPANVDQLPGVIRDAHAMGYNMFSFQPAAYVGNDRRWTDGYRAMTADAVWARIEEGAGTRLPYDVFQVGDVRCNRTAWGFYVGDRWHSVLDPDNAHDLAARDAFLRYLGGVHFHAPPALLAARLVRLAVTHPWLVGMALRWAARTVRRVGGPVALLRGGVTPVTFVMHRFMDAADVAPAWEQLQAGIRSTEPRLAETQERLLACSYAMAHPETGELIPACVQHSVLDPGENAQLITLLPRRR